MKIKFNVTLKQIERYIKNLGEKAYDDFYIEGHVCYAIGTCWWCLLANHPGYKNGQLPCDPRNSLLLQAPVGKFIKSAKANPNYYGKYGLKTFMAAYHGNLFTDDGKPTSLETWEQYEALLDD